MKVKCITLYREISLITCMGIFLILFSNGKRHAGKKYLIIFEVLMIYSNLFLSGNLSSSED